MYRTFLESIQNYVPHIQVNARIIAQIDCLLSFGLISAENNYCKPEVDESKVLALVESRHPVIEHQLPHGESYIPNDLVLNADTQQLIILTGPNMSGKSALLRQTALAVVLTQIGLFCAR